MKVGKTKVLVIVGPTGSGKTSLSVKLAKQFKGEVISADSRQIYKGLDIGTEKVTEEEKQGIPHHMIDVAEVDHVYTAAQFASAGQKAITEINSRGNLPIVAGGTFFYVDTLLGKTSAPKVAPNDELRAKLSPLSTVELFSKLKQLDPVRAENIDEYNPRRLIRAIEIATELGHVPPLPVEDEKYDVLTLGIDVDKVVLRARLRARAIGALDRGLIKETEELLKSGVTRARLMEIGLEYRLVIEHLEGQFSYEELIQKFEEKNWQYAKRQWMWLQKDFSIIWVDPSDMKMITALVQSWLKK